MAQRTRLKGFADNTRINGIGSFVRKRNGIRWSINIDTDPPRIDNKLGITLSQAPILANRRYLNPTEPMQTKGYVKSFEIQDTQYWRKETLAACPIRRTYANQEAQQYCFSFFIEDGIKVFLPQFELARVLFFHNAYLARASLEHGVFENEFDIKELTEQYALINVLNSCNCPAPFFRDPGYRRLLGWILTDINAKISFESIVMHQLREGYDKGIYRWWNFQFDPPPLKETKLRVSGRYDQNTHTMLVFEITGVYDLSSDMSEEIIFYSPKFYIPVQGTGNEGGTRGDASADDYNVDDEEDTAEEGSPILLDAPKTELSFKEPSLTTATAKKKRPAGSGKKDESETGDSEKNDEDRSTEEQNEDGKAPGADWDGLDEQSDDAELYLNKFESYMEMLNLLKSEHGCSVKTYKLRKLPAVGKCKKHLLVTDGNPRCLMVAHVVSNNVAYYLLEVDTSDTNQPLSTLVIYASAAEEIQEQVAEIEKRLLKKSLSWPKQYLDNAFGKSGHFGISHQPVGKDAFLTMEDIKKWAERVQHRL